jgi:hypothetical protein
MKKLLFAVFFIFTLISTVLGQTTYYVNYTNGMDGNLGTEESSPWKTLTQVNSFSFLPGDSILFKCGETWRGQLLPKSGSSINRIVYGSYGNGDLPNLQQSYNMNLESDWTVQDGNIWECTTLSPTDVGNIIFDNEDHAGIKKMNINNLQEQDDFYYKINTGELSIYSEKNPAIVHSIVECALREHIVDFTNCSYITFENLALKYGAAHGFGGSEVNYVTIKNCKISWIGGGDLNMDGEIRYGNGIEFWSNANNCIVENNKIWEIFDTGVTNQCLSQSTQQNIIYRNNVIWNCGMAALEVWNRPESSIIDKIFFENNTCINIGYGWSESQRTDNLGSCFAEFSSIAQTDSVVIRNNIFVNPKRFFYVYHDDETFQDLIIDYNCYYKSETLDTFNVNYTTQDLILIQDFDQYKVFSNYESNSIFDSPEFTNIGADPYQMTPESPCVDAGISTNVPYDHIGTLRPQGAGFDIGAYETIPTFVPNQSIYSSTFKVYPNPSLGNIYISALEVFDTKQIEVYIFDLGGKLLRNFSKELSSKISLNLPSGTYLMQVKNITKTETFTIVII